MVEGSDSVNGEAEDNRPTLYVLTGPTAVGKTELALDWAERRDAEILSCDSLLFYRGMDTGTAKPTEAERVRVPHHGIDIAPVDRQFSVGQYIGLARAVVEDVLSRGKRVLVTGGSGFYLKAFYTPVVDDVEVPDEVRGRVAEIESKEGLEGLRSELLRLDPEGAASLDLRNPRRVANALRRCLATGKTVGELRAEFAAKPSAFADFRKNTTLLSRDREILRERVGLRTAAMLKDGLVEEVRALRAEGLEENPSAATAIGYRETLAFLDGKLNKQELEQAINQNTMRLIKKQLTWFRHQIPVDHSVKL